MEDVTNFVILVKKDYIQRTKFDESPFIFKSFKKYLKINLQDLKNSLEYIDRVVLFDKWNKTDRQTAPAGGMLPLGHAAPAEPCYKSHPVAHPRP